MKNINLFCVILLFICSSLLAQTRPDIVQIQGKPFILMRDYGAIPDDSLSDDLAFVDAVEAASGGAEILFDAGTYNFDNTIAITDRIKMRGAGHGTVLGFASGGLWINGGYNIVDGFRLEGTSDSIGILASPTLAYSELKNLEIISFKTGIDLQKTINSSISDVRIVSYAASGTGVIVGNATYGSDPLSLSTTLTMTNVSCEGGVGPTMDIGIDLQYADNICIVQPTLQRCGIGIKLRRGIGTSGLSRWINIIAPYFEGNTNNITTLGGDYTLTGPRSYGYAESSSDKFTWTASEKSTSAQNQPFLGRTSNFHLKRNAMLDATQTIAAGATATVLFDRAAEYYDDSGYPAVVVATTSYHLANIGYLSSDVASNTFQTREPSLHIANAQVLVYVASAGAVLLKLKTNETFSDQTIASASIATARAYIPAGATETVSVSSSWLPAPGATIWVEFENTTAGSAIISNVGGYTFFEVMKP